MSEEDVEIPNDLDVRGHIPAPIERGIVWCKRCCYILWSTRRGYGGKHAQECKTARIVLR